jgi:hypothetical protein
MSAPSNMKVSSMKPLHVLRGIFRLLKTPILPDNLLKKATELSHPHRSNTLRSNESTAYLMRRYRSAAETTLLSSPLEQERLRKFATEFYQLRRDIVARGDLYTLDAGADQILTPHETSRRAAARAGLQLPELYKDGSKGTNYSN